MKTPIILRQLIKLYRRYCADRSSKAFIKHNLETWNAYRSASEGEGEILVEQTGDASSVIAYSYFSNVLAKRHRAKLVVYRFDWSRKVSWIDQFIAPVQNRIFSSFNCASFLNVDPSAMQVQRAERLFGEHYPRLSKKRDVENLTVDGVWIGDLVYDEYLRQNWDETIDLSSLKFIETLKVSLAIFVYWKDHLDQNEVKAVCLSHCVYKLAILLRLAVSRQIPVYQVNATHVYNLKSDNVFAYTEFYYHRSLFASLTSEVRAKGICEAKKRIERRFAGEVGVDMPYSKKSGFSTKSSQRVIRVSSRRKILIAPHSFSDSPHGYGVSLFPDFYEWLDFLGGVSRKSDFDWYVKLHPDYFPQDALVIARFIEKYPAITLLPSDTSHHQMIEEGVDCLLTVHGTIGFEYAALGVLVINASCCNPHVAFDFNLNPKTVAEYENLLLNLDSQKLRIKLEEVYEYYFMTKLYYSENWLFSSYRDMLKNLGGYQQQFSSNVYDLFRREFEPARHVNIVRTVENFVESEAFRLSPNHMVDAFGVGSIVGVSN